MTNTNHIKYILTVAIVALTFSAYSVEIPENGIYLLGAITPNGEDLDNGVKFTAVDGQPKVLEATCDMYGTGVFGISSTPGASTWQNGAYKLQLNVKTTIAAENYIVLNLSDDNTTNYSYLEAGAYRFILDYRFEDVFLSISKADFQPEEIMPNSLYLTCITNTEYPYSAFTRQGTTLVCSGFALSNPGGSNYCGFFIGNNYGANWNTDAPFYETVQTDQTWNINADSSPVTKMLYLRPNRSSGINNQYVTSPGKYDFCIDFSTYAPILTVSPYHQGTQTAVNDVEVDNMVSVQYYTIDGREVAQPERGIYLVRKGSAVTKVVY